MDHEAEVKSVRLVVADAGQSAALVLLEARDEIVPVFVTRNQGESIERAQDDQPPKRPLTHDLFDEMLSEFDGRITGVRIDDLADNTFYAKVDAESASEHRERRFVYDARPSDGIALAVRADCPITISDDVIDEAGMPPEEFEDDGTDFDAAL